MADELTVEETNALRAKLGLPPLRPRITLKPSVPTEVISTAVEATAVADGAEGSESDDESDLLDSSTTQQASDGTILVLDDAEVLQDKRKPGEKKRARLVVAGSTDAGEGENVRSAARKDKKTFLSSIARSEAPLPKETEAEKPVIANARLYDESDRLDTLEGGSATKFKKKKAHKSGTPVQQTKIIRRHLNREAVVTATEQHSDDDDRIHHAQVAPKVFGRGLDSYDEDDDAKALETSLARARKTAAKVIAPSIPTSSRIQHNEEDDRLETFVPSSEFEFAIPLDARAVTRTKQEVTEPDRSVLEGSGSNGDVAMHVEEPQTAQARENYTLDDSTIAPQASAHPAPPRERRRTLAQTLREITAEGSGKREEIIVGRANDAKPLTDLNKPGDLVVLEYRDDHGHLLTQKEGYRQLMYQYRGEGPGASKKKKRELQLAREQAARSGGTSANGGGAIALAKAMRKDHVVLPKY